MRRTLLALPLLATFATAQEPLTPEFPDAWFWHRTEEQRAKHRPMLGQPMPELDLSAWQNGEVNLAKDLTGHVVVVDFWATWCGPCIRSIPHNNELVERFGEQGLVFVGVCGSKRGQDSMEQVAKDEGIHYPIAKDAAQASAQAWNVLWWPTYAVVDRSGNVRAIGLKSEHVDAVVEKLLKEEAPAKAEASPSIPTEWREPRDGGRSVVDALEGKTAPELTVEGWIHHEATTLAQLKGKVVLLDFWATWCGPCIRSVPHTNELAAKYAKHGLVVIGVCNTRGAEKIAETAKQHDIRYPVVRDVDDRTVKAYAVNGYPDYYLIDRQGNVVVADLANGKVEDAIRLLLGVTEPQPSPGK